MLACVVFDEGLGRGRVEALFAISPLVEHAGSTVFLDVAGTSRLHGGAKGLFAAIRRALDPLVPRGMALASNRFTAEVAARYGVRRPGGAVTVAPGDEALFLSRLPLLALPLSKGLSRRLVPLGLETLGDLASLPVAAVESRYGPEGVRLHRLARGQDDAGLLPESQEGAPTVVRDLDHPLDSLTRLRPLLDEALERLCQGLGERGRGVVRLGLELDLDPVCPEGEVDDPAPDPEQSSPSKARYVIAPASPEDRPALLVDLVCQRLEASPPGRPVTRLHLWAEAWAGMDVHQNALFGEVSRDAARRAEALSRLRATLGEQAVGQTRLVADHRLEQRWAREEPRREPEGAWEGREVPAAPPGSGTALRILPRPRELVPLVSGGRLLGFRCGGRAWHLAGLSAPRRLEGGWWDRAWARDEYDAVTEDGAFLRICRDMRTRRWLLVAERD